MNSFSQLFQDARRIVIKVGSALVIGAADNQVRESWLKTLAEDVSLLRRQGKQVIIVTSGAVGLGRHTLDYGSRRLALEEKQAAAACGQITLISHWAKAFRFENADSFYPAQILLTLDDSENRRRYLNASNTFKLLLAEPHIIPIVNENDTVATEELRVGDNDRLAARVAQMTSADLLILFSDIDGLYTANPGLNPNAEFIPEVGQITTEIEAMAGGTGSALGSGGMHTKIEAAKIALAAGCQMIIGRGTEPHPLRRLVEGGQRGTWFRTAASPGNARKHWISGSLHVMGSFYIDEGALAALGSGKSLLPAGVKSMDGEFGRGDAVLIKTLQGKTVGKGLTAYSSNDARRIIGARSGEIESILGYKYRDTLVHRDDMALEISEAENL